MAKRVNEAKLYSMNATEKDEFLKLKKEYISFFEKKGWKKGSYSYNKTTSDKQFEYETVVHANVGENFSLIVRQTARPHYKDGGFYTQYTVKGGFYTVADQLSDPYGDEINLGLRITESFIVTEEGKFKDFSTRMEDSWTANSPAEVAPKLYNAVTEIIERFVRMAESDIKIRIKGKTESLNSKLSNLLEDMR